MKPIWYTLGAKHVISPMIYLGISDFNLNNEDLYLLSYKG